VGAQRSTAAFFAVANLSAMLAKGCAVAFFAPRPVAIVLAPRRRRARAAPVLEHFVHAVGPATALTALLFASVVFTKGAGRTVAALGLVLVVDTPL
jgi:hypothetical protein